MKYDFGKLWQAKHCYYLKNVDHKKYRIRTEEYLAESAFNNLVMTIMCLKKLLDKLKLIINKKNRYCKISCKAC